MKTKWMQTLSTQFERACQRYPGESLMLLLDIDGTILDMRYMILAVMQAYDRAYTTSYFERLRINDISVHENQVDRLLDELHVPAEAQDEILTWYQEQRWASQAIREMHRPFRGVLDIIRWFQLQPNTSIGLVTGRPESLREDTLRSLNQLGKPYRVQFSDDLLYMNPRGWEERIPDVKVAALKHFQENGYRIFAFIDNEPINLKALAAVDLDKEILLLHANTIFETRRTRVPRGAVRGKEYRLAELIPNEKALPTHVQLAWHGVNDEANLRQFLASDVHWAEMDVRLKPAGWDVILRHDSFTENPLELDEKWFMLDKALDKIKLFDRAVKIDLKAGGMLLEKVLEMVAEKGLSDESLWFNADIEQLMEQGFKLLASAHPDAIIQCPINFLAPLIVAAPEQAHKTMQMLNDWGINRFSISWEQSHLRDLFDQMDQWGYEVNIYGVSDLENFLQAVLLTPRSVTSDFNFPQWHYYGHGPGKGGAYLTYQQTKNGDQ
ncbi:MAG: HAD family hydrolase [Anaerolineales bacterium]|nr:MAG: HAD family hydrolase [Anaerolineales bacterium]